jgi:hypothetical protein
MGNRHPDPQQVEREKAARGLEDEWRRLGVTAPSRDVWRTITREQRQALAARAIGGCAAAMALADFMLRCEDAASPIVACIACNTMLATPPAAIAVLMADPDCGACHRLNFAWCGACARDRSSEALAIHVADFMRTVCGMRGARVVILSDGGGDTA